MWTAGAGRIQQEDKARERRRTPGLHLQRDSSDPSPRGAQRKGAVMGTNVGIPAVPPGTRRNGVYSRV